MHARSFFVWKAGRQRGLFSSKLKMKRAVSMLERYEQGYIGNGVFNIYLLFSQVKKMWKVEKFV